MTKRQTDKLKLAKEHRRLQYQVAMQKFIDGEVPQEYVTERWQKLKAIKGEK